MKIDRLPLFLFLAAVALAPLPFGSVQHKWQAVWATVFGLSVALGALMARPPLLVLVPVSLAAVLAALASTLDLPLYSIANSGNALLALMALTAGMIHGQTRVRAELIVMAIAWPGLIYALLGLLQLAFFSDSLLWTERRAYHGYFLGTFVNRNTAAAYFGICAILWSLSALRRALFFRGWLRGRRGAGLAFSTVVAALMFACVALTGSRAGLVLSIFGAALASAIYLAGRGARASHLRVITGVALGGLTLIAIAGNNVLDRLQILAFGDESRSRVYGAAVDMVRTAPLEGHGAGMFPWLFPAHRPNTILVTNVWDKAHNTYLESAIDFGLPFTAVATALALLAIALVTRRAMSMKEGRLVPSAAIAAAVIAMLHSLVDFPLQIPGYAIAVFALAGAGVSQVVAAKKKGPDNPAPKLAHQATQANRVSPKMLTPSR